MTYGLIGEKLSHSFSPQIHALLGNNDYILMPLAPDKLDDFMQKRDFCGINVTIPYKKAIMQYCDYISDEAKKIGCVNTIVNREGKLYGYNTDYFGFSYMCKSADISFENKKVVILGSGGTSLTAQSVAADCGARKIITVSRTGKDNYDNINKHKDCDILINTTPVGMFPNHNNIPISIKQFTHLYGIVDVIYNPLKTQFLLNAKVMKIKSTSGLAMLVSQAFKAHNLFFNTELDESIIMDIKAKIEHTVGNIVLIGMPGCGKSTVGKLLAKKLNMPFVDTDDEIELRTKMTIPQIFEQHGEEYFRKCENEVIKDICKSKMQVISTGGGSMVDPANRLEFCYDGKLIWLDRDINLLAIKDRPLSQNRTDLIMLHKHRIPIFRQICDKRVTVKEQPTEVVQEILNYLRDKSDH